MAVQRAASRRRREGRRRYTGGPTGFTYSATFGGAQLEGEPYTVAPGSDFSLVPIADARRPHESLRPRHAAHVPTTTSSRARPTGSASTGRSATRTWRRTTTRRSASSASPAPPKGIRSAPDGIFQPPAPLQAHDVLVQRACAKLGIRAVIARQAVITAADERPAAVPLLRAVRPRLHDGVELRRRATCRSSRR